MASRFSWSDESQPEREWGLIVLWSRLKTRRCIGDFDRAGNLLAKLLLQVLFGKAVRWTSVAAQVNENVAGLIRCCLSC